MYFISALLFGISANIDTFVLGFSYGIKKQRIPLLSNMIISLITFLGTLLSIGLGLKMASFVPPEISRIAGSSLLILLGIYYCAKYLLQAIRRRKKRGSITAASLSFQSDSHLTRKDTFILGLTLTVNNAGIGIGASFAGIHFILTSVITFFLSALFLISGNRLGARFAPPFIKHSADLLSGIIIIALGIYELFF